LVSLLDVLDDDGLLILIKMVLHALFLCAVNV
jgi:hypothetical protein